MFPRRDSPRDEVRTDVSAAGIVRIVLPEKTEGIAPAPVFVYKDTPLQTRRE
jgi:hypothetical protein